MDVYILSPSKRSEKKWQVKTPEGKTIYFGAKGYSDYTIHKDPERKKRYEQRHAKHEDWENLSTAGAWARWLLWNKPTLDESIRDMEDRFIIEIKREK
jgi:hypothetical protein